MADGRHIGLVGRLVGLRLDPDFDLLVVVEHRVDRLEQPLDRRLGRSCSRGCRCLRARARARSPLSRGRARCRSSAACGRARTCGPWRCWRCSRRPPSARRTTSRGATNSGTRPWLSSMRLHLGALLRDLRGREVVHPRHDVVIVELHAVEAERLVEREFLLVREGLADFGAERVGAFADVPGAEGEAVFGGLGDDEKR